MNRNQTFERLRVFLMIMVILHHCGIHGGLVSLERLDVSRYGMLISSGGQISVASFYMLFGYFAIENEFKFSRIFRVWICAVEYCLLASLLSIVQGGDILLLVYAFFPVSNRVYSFVSQYIILALIFPFFKEKLSSLKRNEYITLILVLFGIVEVVPNLLGLNFVRDSLIAPLFWAIVGSYIKRFGHDFVKHRVIFNIGLIVACVGLLFVVFCTPWLYAQYTGTYSIVTFVISTILLLKTQEKETKKNWYIVSKTMFGIFVWHDNPTFRHFLWEICFEVKELANKENSFIVIIMKTLFFSCVVFVVGVIIEYIRIKINLIIAKVLDSFKWWDCVNYRINEFYNLKGKISENKNNQ